MKRRTIGTAALALALVLALAAWLAMTAAEESPDLFNPGQRVQLVIASVDDGGKGTVINSGNGMTVSNVRIEGTTAVSGGAIYISGGIANSATISESGTFYANGDAAIIGNGALFSNGTITNYDPQFGSGLKFHKVPKNDNQSVPDYVMIQGPDGELLEVDWNALEDYWGTGTDSDGTETWTITGNRIVNVNQDLQSGSGSFTNSTSLINNITYADNADISINLGNNAYNMVISGTLTSAIVNQATDLTVGAGVRMDTISIGAGGQGTVVNLEGGSSADTVVIGATNVTLNNGGTVRQIIFVNCGDTGSQITGDGTVSDVQYATTHNWGPWKTTQEANCTTKGWEERVCNDCKETRKRSIRKKAHTLTMHPEIPATCEEDGTKAYYTCSTCDGVFKDGNGNPFESESERVIPATGHAWGEATYEWSEDNSTCTATRVCANNPEHPETETVKAIVTDNIEAGCETAGGAVWTATFTNPAFGTRTKETRDIPATGHKWGEATYTWSEDFRTCTGTRVCENNQEHVDSVTVNAEGRIVTKATCETEGLAAFRAIFPEDSGYTTQVTQTEIPVTGHDWGEVKYIWSEDNSTCTAIRVCQRDTSHVETIQTVETTSATTPSTCPTPGKKTFTADFTSEGLESVQKEVEIPGKHQLTLTQEAESACTESGNTAYYTCSGCGHYFSDPDGEDEIEEGSWILEPLGHDLEHHEGRAATCNENGWVEYDTCKRVNCGYTTYQVIPAAHKLEELTPAAASTCKEAGNPAYYTCSECGHYFSDAEGKNEIGEDELLLPLADHQLTLVPASEATETQHGNSTPYYKCGVCGRCFLDDTGENEIQAENYVIHNYVDNWEIEVPSENEIGEDNKEYVVYYHLQECSVSGCPATRKVESGREEALFTPED